MKCFLMVHTKCFFCIFYKRTVFLMLHKSGCFCALWSGYKRFLKNQNVFLGWNIDLGRCEGAVIVGARSLQLVVLEPGCLSVGAADV